MRDLNGTTLASINDIRTRFWAAAQAHGFEEWQTPVIERASLFSHSLGKESDVVSKEMFTFRTAGGDDVCLRPEGTAGVVRAAVQQGKTNDTQAAYWGPMFRYERPQRGRYRQFIQCGVEAMGRGPASGPESDADVMGAAWAFIRGLEWERHGIVPTVLLNTLGDAESRATYRDELESYLSKHAADLSQLSRDRLARGAVLRVLDSKAPQDQAIAADAPKSTDSLTPVSADRFRRLQDLLLALEIPFQLDSRLVRGLDYYRDTVFEIVAKGLPPHAASSEQGVGQLGTVLAGGRYDDILGTTMPGIGWAAGVDRLAHIQDLLSSQAETTPHEPWAPLPRSGLIDIVPVWQSLPQQPATAQAGLGLAACSLASKIRSGLADRGREDIRVRLRADSRKLRKHLTTSHQAGAHRVVMVSFDQSGNHRVEAKDMHSGQQRELEAGEDIADWLLAN